MSLEKLLKTGKRILQAGMFGTSLLIVGCKGPGTPIITDPILEIPAKPSMSIDPTKEEPNRIMQLTIYDNSDNEDGFIIERKVGNNGAFSSLANLSENEESYSDNDITASTQYTYRIKAYNEDGSSAWYERSAISVGPQITSKYTHAIADTWVYEGAPGYPDYADKNYGKEGRVRVSGFRENFTGGKSRGLLQFSLPSLPSYSTGFEGANLTLWDASGGTATYDTPIEMYAFLNLNSWNEDTVTHNTRPGTQLSDGGALLGHIIKYADDNLGHVYTIDMDVSNLVSFWYSSSFPNFGANYGLTLYTPDDNIFWDFYSKEGYPAGSAKLRVDYSW